jgi:flagellar hook capping protein FlgD
VARIASTVLVVALLAATAAAFVLTQGLKSQPSPIRGTQVDDIFSPVCACETETVAITFRLREDDRIDAAIVDERGDVVRVLERGARYEAGRVELRWDGRGDTGHVLPEGSYRPRIHLREERQTIVLPNPIELDVTPPAVVSARASPHVLSPDGDRRRDSLVVRYELDEAAKALLFVDGIKRVETRFPRTEDAFRWYGRIDGRPAERGVYSLTLSAKDPAGNVGEAVRFPPLVVRYVALGRDRIVVSAGARFAVRVSSDARTVRWRLGRRSGVAVPGTLTLRAPLQKGRFTLTVTANGHSDRAAVLVREPAR